MKNSRSACTVGFEELAVKQVKSASCRNYDQGLGLCEQALCNWLNVCELNAGSNSVTQEEIELSCFRAESAKLKLANEIIKLGLHHGPQLLMQIGRI